MKRYVEITIVGYILLGFGMIFSLMSYVYGDKIVGVIGLALFVLSVTYLIISIRIKRLMNRSEK